ncbi:MAG: hypothetical protein GEU91_18710 [Rhizobiales bacterium]|nr:hypothetical protein [Hyphomicrobiales bacterium]
MHRSIMICAVTGVIAGFTATAAAQVGRDGLDQGARAKTGVAPAAAGACSPNKIAYKTSDVSVNMSSNVFAVVPQTLVAFTQGGASPSCVIVRYSAMAAAQESWIPLRVVLDGSVIAEPGVISYEGETEIIGISLARSFDFVFPAVAPGAHRVRVDWRSFRSTIIYMHRRTIIVQHR